MTIHRFFTISLLLAATCYASDILFSLSLAGSELALLSDSSDASAWGTYGLALLYSGDPNAENALRTCSYLGDSSEGKRGRASLAVQSCNVQEAIETLVSERDDVLAQIMLCSILQYSGDSEESSLMIEKLRQDSLPAGALELLKIRQFRLAENNRSADSLAAIIMQEHSEPFSDIIAVDLFTNSPPGTSVDTTRVLQGLRADAVLTGSVYFAEMSKVALSRSTPLLFAIQILTAQNKREMVKEMIAAIPIIQQNLRIQIIYADLLLSLGELTMAEEVIEDALIQVPDSPELLALMGRINLKGGRYWEAYSQMDEAVTLTGNHECIAVMGLAAELAGEFPLALEAYSPLLNVSADSIVLINRIRNSLFDQTLNYPCNPTENNPWRNPGSGLRADLSLSYYRTAGIYSQESVAGTSSFSYRYGLYNSRLSLSAGYSENSWQGSSCKLRQFHSSISARNYSSARLFETVDLRMEQLNEEAKRWKFEALTGCGYRFSVGSFISFIPTLEAGRKINKWDDDLFQRNSWVYAPGLRISLSNFLRSSINPSLSLSCSASCDILDSSQYEVDAGATVSSAISRYLSISYSYKVEYQSSVPPENESETNTVSQASLTFHL